MNLSVLRRIDKIVGSFVGIVLLGVLFIKERLIRQRQVLSPGEVKQILIIKFFGFGSLLLASPAMRKAKSKYPAAELTILTTTGNRRLCEMLPAADRVICMDIGSFPKFIVSFFAAFSEIGKLRPDVVFDLEFLTNFSALVALLVRVIFGATATCGFNAPVAWRNRVFHRTTIFDHSAHVMAAFLKTVDALVEGETENSDKEPDVTPEREALLQYRNPDYSDRLFQEHTALADCSYLICVNINSGALCLLRRWPLEYFTDLISRLVLDSRVGIVLIGSPDEESYVAELVTRLPDSPRLVNVCGMTPLEDLIGLFANCDLLITNDSGPLHLAYILDLPTISFFGPETPRLYGPVGEKHIALYQDMWCSPCINIYNSKLTKCRDNLCLKQITPESVEALIKEKYLQRPSQVAAFGNKV